MLRKKLRVKVLGNGEDIEADVSLRFDEVRGWCAAVKARWRGEELIHETPRVDGERDALAEAAIWMRSHFKAKTTWLVAITGGEEAA